MSENRIAYGTMVEILTYFTDYRRGSNKTNTEYKAGQILPVDSFMLYSIESIVKSGQAKVRNDLVFNGYEEDFKLTSAQFTEYPLIKFKFASPSLSVVLPQLNEKLEYQSRECVFINAGSVAFSIKYSNESNFPNFIINPNESYKAIFMYDGTIKGRWIFEPILYRQDEVLEGNKGSETISSGGASGVSGVSIKTIDYETSEVLEPGNLVTLYKELGITKCKKAIATSLDTKALGFVKNTFNIGQVANIYQSGINEYLTSLTINKPYYLSETLAGTISELIPVLPNSIIQKIGDSISETSININIEEEFEIIN